MLLMTIAFIGSIILIVTLASWFLTWIMGKCMGFHTHFSYFALTGLGLLTTVCLAIAYGYYIGRWQMKVNNIDYRNADIPAAFDGYRIVHISDFHVGSFDGADDKLERMIDSINAQQPDLICFTGDLVTASPQELLNHVDALKRLHAKDGVMSVLGNHDFLIYSFPSAGAEQEREIERLAQMERDVLGWQLLRNQHHTIYRDNDSITIIGVDNQHCSNQGFQTINRGNLSEAMVGTSGFRILLTHDPSHWTGEVVPNTDIPLTLSGHTHNGQVSILGWSPSSLTFKETAGRYENGAQTLYINTGLGTTVPFRIGVKPEITLITLRRE